MELDLQTTTSRATCWNEGALRAFANTVTDPSIASGKIACQGCIIDGEPLCTAQFTANPDAPVDTIAAAISLPMVSIPDFKMHPSDRPFDASDRAEEPIAPTLEEVPTRLGRLLNLVRPRTQ